MAVCDVDWPLNNDSVGLFVAVNKSNIQDNIAESSSSFEDWTFSGKVILGAIIWYMVVLYDSRFSVSLILCHFIDKERASEGSRYFDFN
ncbi:hypothetical protein Bca101_000297 [Brassica carinata]